MLRTPLNRINLLHVVGRRWILMRDLRTAFRSKRTFAFLLIYEISFTCCPVGRQSPSGRHSSREEEKPLLFRAIEKRRCFFPHLFCGGLFLPAIFSRHSTRLDSPNLIKDIFFRRYRTEVSLPTSEREARRRCQTVLRAERRNRKVID